MVAWRSILVAIVVFLLGVSFAVPLEDVLETSYDETDPMPCESTPATFIAVSTSVVRVPTSTPLRWRSCPETLARIYRDCRTDSPPSASNLLVIVHHALRC